MRQTLRQALRCGFGLAVVVSALALGGAAAAEPQLDRPLKAILAVGEKGRGNAEAARAWQELVKADAAAIPGLLTALDGASPLAANWIRGAIDAIAERELPGGKLPTSALEKFALDTSHAPRARRLAFEWLARADKTAPDRLIPGMLHDPSTEFRRDAVARLLAEAGRTPTSDAAALKTLYQKALSGARDKDQVETIAAALKKLGQEVDLAAHFGFILRWKVIGPFENAGGRGFNVAYPPEKELDLKASYPGKAGTATWKDHETKERYGQVDLNKAVGKHMGAAAYALTDFQSEKRQKVNIRITSLCAVKLWVNGRQLTAHEVYHSGPSDVIDHYIAEGTLEAGKNQILVKCLQNEQKEDWAQNWDFQLRVCDATGTAVLSADR
jgi:hypothetical protein